MFSTSIHGELFHISYHLDVFVKHSSWNEYGMGNYVTFPITIVSPEKDIPFMKAKASDFETFIGEEWNASVCEKIVQLSLIQNEDGSMVTQVTKDRLPSGRVQMDASTILHKLKLDQEKAKEAARIEKERAEAAKKMAEEQAAK